MAGFLNGIFNGHDTAVMTLGRRAEVLANNLANVDTPGFKARDIDFKAILKQESQALQPSMNVTHSNHLGGVNALNINSQLKYRTPIQGSLDGNTVDSQVEIAKFSENAMRYQASLQFLNGSIKGLLTAIREGN